MDVEWQGTTTSMPQIRMKTWMSGKTLSLTDISPTNIAMYNYQWEDDYSMNISPVNGISFQKNGVTTKQYLPS